MGFFSDLFGGGPSDGDIARQEEKARLAEVDRLRIAEQKLRRRESKETAEGDGFSLATNVTLGSDREDDATEFGTTVSREVTINKPKQEFDPKDMPRFNFGNSGIRL